MLKIVLSLCSRALADSYEIVGNADTLSILVTLCVSFEDPTSMAQFSKPHPRPTGAASFYEPAYAARSFGEENLGR